tara:strand:- start:270 stop:725 length:456 start_codon:yes stop_codon:yes gene_type:complete
MKDGFLDEEEKGKFREMIDFAKEKGIELIYESNSFCKAEHALRFLEDFPEINYCLDFGHVNTGIKSGKFGMDLMEFIEKIKSRIVNIHAHNNDGTEDRHDSLDDGNFPWRDVLDKLKDQNLSRIVVECKPKGEKVDINLKTKKILEDYYSE